MGKTHDIIDLTSSPEPDGPSPSKAAKYALQRFQPRQSKQPANREPAIGNGHARGNRGQKASLLTLRPSPRLSESREQENETPPRSANRRHEKLDDFQADDAANEIRRMRSLNNGDATSGVRRVKREQRDGPPVQVNYEMPSGFKRPLGGAPIGSPQNTRSNQASSRRQSAGVTAQVLGINSKPSRNMPPPGLANFNEREERYFDQESDILDDILVARKDTNGFAGLPDLTDRPRKRQRLSDAEGSAQLDTSANHGRTHSNSRPHETAQNGSCNEAPPNSEVSPARPQQSPAAVQRSPVDSFHTKVGAGIDSPSFPTYRPERSRLSAAARLRQSLDAERQHSPNGRNRMSDSPNSFGPHASSSRQSMNSVVPSQQSFHHPSPQTRDEASTPDALSSKSDSERERKRIEHVQSGESRESSLSRRDSTPRRAQTNSTSQRQPSLGLRDQVLPPPAEPKLKLKAIPAPAPRAPSATVNTSNHGIPYTVDEDQLLWDLKENHNVSWAEMPDYFNGRTRGSLQTRFSHVLRPKFAGRTAGVATTIPHPNSPSPVGAFDETDSTAVARPQRRKRNNVVSTADGFISWTDVTRRNLWKDVESQEQEQEKSQTSTSNPDRQYVGERPFPRSISKIIRQNEFGSNSSRDWTSSLFIADELKERVFDDVGPRKFFKGTSSDVTCLSWAPDGRRFAAGSIAISDDRSMQYNKPNNLLLGDFEESTLVELPDHHIPRPVIMGGSGNVNERHSMRESQDTRLFMTVASVQFSPDSRVLYSAGGDCKVRAYQFDGGVDKASCLYELEHSAPLDLLSVSNTGLVATACHQSTDGSISVYNGSTLICSLSPSRTDSQTSRAIYPSALRWGSSPRFSNLLLAGFSIDSFDEERDIAGETCLWDIAAEQRLEVHAVTRNVFDIAWHPSPTSTSHSFAIASTPGAGKVNKKTRSVVQCFAPKQGRASRVMELECPAFDINDVIYCPYDDNYIAVGATDGKVYVWDQRFANPRHMPLHVLEHGESLNVLDHDRDLEIADTGIRFLSWGATSSRLYSGSSDGVVKTWNPCMATGKAHINDVATFSSAVMSGGFSPDYRELLIGEDQGRLNLLSVGYGEKTARAMEPFDLIPAPTPRIESAMSGRAAARELLDSGQIEIRPMGALPIRQAVQGPNYNGPYIAPQTQEFSDADIALKAAQDHQHEVYLEADIGSTQNSETGNAIREADRRVQDAQEKVESLQARWDDAKALEPKARELQRKFRRYQKQLKKSEALSGKVEACQLHCNYLPPHADDEGVDDNQQSKDRIPTALWPSKDVDISTATAEDLIEAGLTSKCMTCFGPALKPRAGKRAQCAKCFRKANGLTTFCDQCAAPTRVLHGESPTNYCERCGFACFRCGKPAVLAKSNICARCGFACFRCGRPALLAKDRWTVQCDSCVCVWRINALGYQLLRCYRCSQPATLTDDGQICVCNICNCAWKIDDEDYGIEQPLHAVDIVKAGKRASDRRQTDDETAPIEIGDEIEHYASRWQTTQ